MKNRFARNGKRKALSLRNLSIAAMASLAFIGVNSNQSAMAAENSHVIASDSVAIQPASNSLLNIDNGLNLNNKVVLKNAVSNVDVSEKIANLNLGKDGHFTGFAADVTPTLDKLHEQDPEAHPEESAYTLTETEQTSGTNIYQIDGKYYQMEIKDGVTSQTRMQNTTDHSETNYIGHYINRGLSATIQAYGGAIYNSNNGKLGNIIGDFINNSTYTTGNDYIAAGGAIYNQGTIGNITGDFIHNNTQASNSNVVYGGAIVNTGTIGNITGNFIVNYAPGDGGAIYNSGTIGEILGNFINNLTSTSSGGAIHNSGTIGEISGDFIGNSAKNSGGAIYTSKSMTLAADGVNHVISGNLTGTDDNKKAEAIYVGSKSANFNIKATNGGSWTIDDYINGSTNYNLTFTGDGTGVINYNNVINGAPKVTFNNIIFDQTDGVIRTYNFKTLTSTDSKFAIDMNQDTKTADKFTTSSTANGTITLSVLNLIGENDDITGKYQILSKGSGTAGLAFADDVKVYENGIEQEFVRGYLIKPSDIENTVNFGDTYANTEGWVVTKTSYDNDSIEYIQNSVFDQILSYLNQKETTEDRTFNFLTSSDVYTVTEALGTTTVGTLNIIGVEGENGELSTIDFNNNQGFYIPNATNLNIENVKLTNSSKGAAITNSNSSAVINLNNVDFENNSSYSYGGAISNNGIINNIYANFNNNKTSSKYGGAIYNVGTIGDISGSFAGNFADGSNSYGGAIYNTGTIGNILSSFTSNTTRNVGGAISNGGTIGDITGNFTNNSASWGGAIYNYGTIGNIIGDFIGNSSVSSSGYRYNGGAIYTTKAMTLLADNEDHVIRGNYVSSDGGTTKNYEAIYVGATGQTFTVKAINNGSWTIDDYINGSTGYGLTFTGDDTGIINYNNDIYSSPNLTIENVTFDQTDGVIRNYSLSTLTSNNGKLSVDIDFENNQADTFTVSGNANGTIYLSTLNFLGDKHDGTFQILNIGSGDAQLAFGDNIKVIDGKEELEPGIGYAFTVQDVDDTVTFGDIYTSRGGLALATTNTTNDSVQIVSDAIHDHILTYISQKETPNARNFNFVTAGDVYTITEPLNDTSAGILNINGVAGDDGTLSTIDFNGIAGFDITNPTRLNIENVKITNTITSAISASEDSKVNLTNVIFENNDNSGLGGALYNRGTAGEISGKFINNSAWNLSRSNPIAYGGAIYNGEAIHILNADFEGNTATANSNAFGGALYNTGIIGAPQEVFKAWYNKLVVTDNDGNVITTLYGAYTEDDDLNLAQVTSGEYTFTENDTFEVTISEFIEEFYDYYSGDKETEQEMFERALENAYNNGIITENPENYNAPEPTPGYIMGNFINNHVEGAHADGGAIYNVGTITEIIGDFISNYGHSTGTDLPHGISSASANSDGGPKKDDGAAKCGGAIYNAGIDAVIGNITGNFTDNRYLADHVMAFGGGIFNANGATIGNINGDFTENYTIGYENIAAGGAIYNAGFALPGGTNGGDINQNRASKGGNNSPEATAKVSTIGDLNGDFTGNYAKGIEAYGGAIYNAGGGNVTIEAGEEEGGRKDGTDNNTVLMPEIGNITGNFTRNYAESTGIPEVLPTPDDDTLSGGEQAFPPENIQEDNINLYAAAAGGAIYNENAKIGNITGDFKENYAKAIDGETAGGAISNISNPDTDIAYAGDFGSGIERDDAGKGLRDLNSDGETLNSKIILGKIGIIKGEFDSNYALTDKNNAAGGAIVNSSNIERIQNSLFKNNFAKSTGGEVLGGAIANKGNIGIDTPLNKAVYGIINVTDNEDNTIATLYVASCYNSETGKYEALKEEDITSGQYNFSDAPKLSVITLDDLESGKALLEAGENTLNAIPATFDPSQFGSDDDDPPLAVVPDPSTDPIVIPSRSTKGGDEQTTGDNQPSGKETGDYQSPDKETDTTDPTPEERLAAVIEAAAERGVYYSTANPTEYSTDLVSTGADSIVNSSFQNNYVKTDEGKGYGGAVYTTTDLMLTSKDNYEFLIDGNYVEDKNGTRPEAVYVDAGASAKVVEGAEVIEVKIYMSDEEGNGWYSHEDAYIDHIESASKEPPTLTVNAINNGRFTINDQIVGSKEASDAQGTITYSENPYIYKYRELGHGVYDEQLDQKVWAFVTAIQDNETGEWYETEAQRWSAVTGTDDEGNEIYTDYSRYYDKSQSEWVTLVLKYDENTDRWRYVDTITGEQVDVHAADEFNDNGNTYWYYYNEETDEDELVLTVENTGEKVYLEYDEDMGAYRETENPDVQTIELGNRRANLAIKGDETGEVFINNNIKNLNITHEDVTTTVSDYMFLNQTDDGSINSLTMNSGILNLGSMSLVPLQFEMFGINGGTINISSVDVDLANKVMGRITANNYSEAQGGIIKVHAFNLLSDGVDLITPVAFADESFKNVVVSDVTEAFTPIYRYEVEYDTNKQYGQETEEGYFVFKRSNEPLPPDPTGDSDTDIDIDIDTDLDIDIDNDTDVDNDTDIDNDIDVDNDTDVDNDADSDDDPTPPPSPTPGGGGHSAKDFNPAILASPVAIQIAGQATMNQAFQYVFEHADAFTQMPAIDRFARIHNNEYALSTDFNSNLGGLDAPTMNKGVWVRPYTSFDKTDLKNGPEVESVSYGTIVGADTDFRKMRNGWTNVGTGYIGYFGSQVNFKGADISMNGGLLGVTETFYKGNFFTALTASVGGGFAESHTMYGKDELTTLMAGVASKTGYNFEFKEGKFIVQPILKMDYTMINTFDYTNAAGIRIDNKPMHTIQINPSVRFIGNLKGGWQPYASVGMVWNLMNETDVRANGVELPSMRTKPYVEYGVGVQRHWNDKFTAFGQAMVRNGGRTGIAFTAGFRWALGKDEQKNEKNVNLDEKKQVTVIKGERSQSTGAAVTTEQTEAIQIQPLNTDHLLYKGKPLTKEEIAARAANLNKYNNLIK